MADLKGHCVVITGAARSMGAAHAKGAAALGAKVVVNDINRDGVEAVVAEIRAAGGQAVGEVQDIRDPEAAKALIGRCISEFGKITGLVNNAAVIKRGDFGHISVDDVRAQLEVNVVGLFNCSQAAVAPMLAQGRGSIVNITSGAQTGQAGISVYGATKGAVASFTYAWAAELRGKGVRVNAVSPIAATGMSGDKEGLPPPEANSPPVFYLLSDRSENVTGQVVRIVGNRLSLMCHPANRAPVLERDRWDLDSVAEAFDQTLGALQLPTNVATYQVTSVEAETYSGAMKSGMDTFALDGKRPALTP